MPDWLWLAGIGFFHGLGYLFLGRLPDRSQEPQVVAGTEYSHYSLEYFVLRRLHPLVLQKILTIYLTVGGWLSYFGQNFETTLLGGKR